MGARVQPWELSSALQTGGMEYMPANDYQMLHWHGWHGSWGAAMGIGFSFTDGRHGIYASQYLFRWRHGLYASQLLPLLTNAPLHYAATESNMELNKSLKVSALLLLIFGPNIIIIFLTYVKPSIFFRKNYFSLSMLKNITCLTKKPEGLDCETWNFTWRQNRPILKKHLKIIFFTVRPFIVKTQFEIWKYLPS